MSQLIMWNLVTVDGYFEGEEKWDIGFHELAWGPVLEKLSNEFGDRAGALVFGRVTAEGMAAHWKTAKASKTTSFMNTLPKIVASRTLTALDWNNTRVVADIVPELKQLKASTEGPLYVFGSAELTHSLLEAGLVDQLIVCTVPVLLGKGTPLFKPGSRVGLQLTDTSRTATGCVVSTYDVRNTA
jgi:dihydrofolate reductase